MSSSTASAATSGWPAASPPARLWAVPAPAPSQHDRAARLRGYAYQAAGVPALAALVARDEIVTRVMGVLSAYAKRDQSRNELRACHQALEEDLEIIERCCEMEVRHSLENRVRRTRAQLEEVDGPRGMYLRHEPRRRLPQALWTHGG